MAPFDAKSVREFIENYPLAHLDAGSPRSEVRGQLTALTAPSLFAPLAVTDRPMAECCVSALWLWHNYLDESHKICQEIETSAGSAWHGLMHRREGDFWNANYWFVRVKDRGLFSGVADEFKRLGYDAKKLPPNLSKLIESKDWSPSDFTNEIQAILKRKEAGELQAALWVANAEWRALFRACWNAAVQ